MNNNRGIFENLPNPSAPSPFSVVQDPASSTPSPFTAFARPNSPFAASEDPAPKAKLPERRKSESPFQVPDAHEGYGFEAPAPSPFAAVPFEPAAAPAPSPFAVAPASEPMVRTIGGNTPAPTWPPVQAAQPAPQAAPFSQPAPEPVAFAAAPAPAPAPEPQAPARQPARPVEQESDSFSIRQLELRAIFGVDREMSTEEIMQRARSLPGIRHINRVTGADVAAVDAIKQVVANLGFGAGSIKLYAGSVPIEFIRESGVLLAVQTDGGFAPGVRETLMIVAREISRSA